MNRKSTPIPEPIAQLQRQLEQFAALRRGGRSCRSPCGRPQSSWLGSTVFMPSPARYG